MSTVMISCGEASGDLYAGALADQLRALDPEVRILGFGGDRLKAAGADLVGHYHGLAVTGIVEALRVIPRSLAMYRRLVAAARHHRPDVFVAIDFPDFNFRVARAIKKLGIPVVYYIPPQLWAWRSGRMKTLEAITDRIAVIFPFEPEYYEKAGASVTFVGHPLAELAVSTMSRHDFLNSRGFDSERPTVALLPGSRTNEVQEILPRLLAALPLIIRGVPQAQFVLARAPGLPDALFKPLGEISIPVSVVSRQTDDVLASADVVVTASGTATVQAAIHERPMVVVYRVSPLTYAIGHRFLHVDTYAMVNLVAGTRIAPELIQADFTPEAVAEHTIRLLLHEGLREVTIKGLREVKAKLGGTGASRRAAEVVLETAAKKQG